MSDGASVPTFRTRVMPCTVCGRTMFYSEENLVHVCLTEEHGVLCFFEPDSCWFAADPNTASLLRSRGLKFHIIPKDVFEGAGLGKEFECEYSKNKEE